MNHPTVVQQMKNKLQGKDFLRIGDFTKEELMDLIEFAIKLKNMQKLGEPHRYLEGKTLAMIFEKSSTRTRVSFETGMFQLGGAAQFLSSSDMQLGNGETIADTAKVLSRYVDAIMIRTFGHDIVVEMAENATVPVINGLTDDAHPCQVLADLMTIYEKKGSFDGLKFAFVGDGNNMSQSLLMGCAIMGIDCYIAVPEGNEVKQSVLKQAQEKAKLSGSSVVQTYDPHEAVKGVDIIYTDVWASMGWEGDKEERLKLFADYQVNEALVAGAKDDYLFMHCLPAIRGEEVAAEVIDGANSVVFDQAENRLHAQKAVLASIV
ncbi:ornithine carbamoyltransferase [Pseudogracilibacillus auburnensis]|uniref:Ornithine carbamoyltransferase n=2 Tax=Pseudogracilibacillus auburnensis TaxID=1494959 RepID=A0A2V3W283_9BACI|nr:ornithine carbamoyltransferase [Pseudogracilibacillus auburnensis]